MFAAFEDAGAKHPPAATSISEIDAGAPIVLPHGGIHVDAHR
jgi:hypothetical protein